MKDKLFNSVSDFLKRNIITCLVVSIMLGGVVGFVAANKRINTGCVMAMENVDDKKEDKKIKVDLSGAVNNPGIYELDAGSRVGDLISLGGGVAGESSSKWVSKSLNLSKVLEDSSKIYIPFEWEMYVPDDYDVLDTVKPVEKSTPAESSSNDDEPETTDTPDSTDNNNENSGRINVNSATSSELDTLPGIGPAFAEKVISNRPYKDFTEFQSKSGLYKSTAESIKDLISF